MFLGKRETGGCISAKADDAPTAAATPAADAGAAAAAASAGAAAATVAARYDKGCQSSIQVLETLVGKS